MIDLHDRDRQQVNSTNAPRIIKATSDNMNDARDGLFYPEGDPLHLRINKETSSSTDGQLKTDDAQRPTRD